MALGSSGCLITDSPEFAAPHRVVLLQNLEPPTGVPQEIEIEPGNTTSPIYKRDKYIRFDIVSEDLGHPLDAFVVIDFKDVTNSRQARDICPFRQIPPTTFGSKRDRFECQLNLNTFVPLPKGCQTIAVVVSHDFEPRSLQPREPGDVAYATWFYHVGVDKNDPDFKYDICMPDQTPPADGGADARMTGGHP